MPKRKGFNDYYIREDIVYIPIINKKGVKRIVQIDLDDLDRLIELNCSWCLGWDKKTKDYYVKSQLRFYNESGKRIRVKTIYLHRFLLNTEEDVDHIDRDHMNNRKYNLREADRSSNMKNRSGLNSNNTSGYRNVSHDGKGNPIVQLQDKNGKNNVWRDFRSFEEAGEFARLKRIEWYGEFSGEEI